MSKCPTIDELSGYASGACAPEDVLRIEAHLAECISCCERCEAASGDGELEHQIKRVLDAEQDDAEQDDASSMATTSPPTSGGDSGSCGDFAPTDGPLRIEGYRILSELGRGGMGVVYLADQIATKRKVALKVLLEGPFASETAKRRFEREVELAAQLDHRNIVTVLESGIDSGHYYFAMQYIEGQRLDSFLKSRNAGVNESLRLFIKTCDAVNYAHQRGVIHRDLKPTNVIVSDAGEPFVLDFGLAKVTEPGGSGTGRLLSMPGELMGTLPYMSPEQTSAAHHDIDVRSDIYSLGVMLYRVLTGHYPYKVTGHHHEVIQRIQEVEPTRPSHHLRGLDDDIDTIVLKALAKSRERRYQSADALARDLERFLAGEPIEAKRDSGTYVLRKFIRRNRAPLAVAATLAVLGISAVAAIVNQRATAARAATIAIVTDLVGQPDRALSALDTSSRRVEGAVADTINRHLFSSAYAERVIGARGGLLISPERFWDSVDGGPLWQGGEWLEVAKLPATYASRMLERLYDKASTGTARQRYVAFCLLGLLAGEKDTDIALRCADSAMNDDHAGVRASAWWAAKRLGVPIEQKSMGDTVVDSVSGLTFVRLPATDSFVRGSPATDPDRFDDEDQPVTGVPIADLMMSQTETTMQALRSFIADGAAIDSHIAGIEDRMRPLTATGLMEEERQTQSPVGFISLATARRFCEWLSGRGASAQPARRYRLPTEEEWEYASRGGNAGRFCFGDDPGYVRYFAACDANEGRWPIAAAKMPNWYGLFDMHGSLWEWSETRYPVEHVRGDFLAGRELWIYKGGAFHSPALRCRSAQRNYGEANASSDYQGFRIVMEWVEP